MKTLHYFAFVAIGLLSIACSSSNPTQTQQGSVAQPDWMAMQDTSKLGKPVKEMTEDDWKKKLTPSQYYILREKGTERAFTGKYWNNHQEGLYSCAGCGTALFTSKLKYESGCGWPSFFDSIDEDKIKTQTDMSLGMVRTEIVCAKCDGHLGHVFKDGPPPTGLRYCVNSESLSFAPAKGE